MDHENSMEQAKDRILDAAMLHAPFDGWSETTLRSALTDSEVASGLGRALYPRGGIDLAVAYHQRGDRAMQMALTQTDLGTMRIRERITHAVRLRIELGDKELVRRGSALFGLPSHAIEGSRLIWGTADAIWTALHDTSRDMNWYTKRATLSAVYAATVLFWLGDTSDGDQATWEFLDRRIENVMQIEKAKAGMRANPIGKALINGPFKVFDKIRAPQMPDDLPGRTGF